MVDHKGGTHTNTSFERNWELKHMHKLNRRIFSGPIQISKRGKHRCLLPPDLTHTHISRAIKVEAIYPKRSALDQQENNPNDITCSWLSYSYIRKIRWTTNSSQFVKQNSEKNMRKYIFSKHKTIGGKNVKGATVTDCGVFSRPRQWFALEEADRPLSVTTSPPPTACMTITLSLVRGSKTNGT
jgi:hypothetical protein